MQLAALFNRPQVPRNEDTLLDVLAPDAAHLAVLYLESQGDDSWQAVAWVTGVVAFFVGWFLLIVDWYTSIMGVRAPMSIIGLVAAEDLWKFPAIWWFVMPLLLTISQIVPRAVPGLRLLWWPSIIYNSVTTAVFFALAINTFMARFNFQLDTTIVGLVGAIVGMGIAFASEQLLLTGIMIIRCAIKW